MERKDFIKLTRLERMQRAIDLFRKNDIKILQASVSVISVEHGKNKVLYYPAKDWYSGKSVKDGRHIENLIAQIKNESSEQHTGAIKEEYWLIDKELFRRLGKVDTPIFKTISHEEAFLKSQKIPNSCVVLTRYNEKIGGGVDIKYQQISNYRKP